MSSHDDEARLARALEVAAHQFQVTATELRSIADDLPRRAQSHARRLRTAAERLDGIAVLLGSEVMVGPEPGFVGALLGGARTVFGYATALGLLIVSGIGDEVGERIVERVTGTVSAAETAANHAEEVLIVVAQDFEIAEDAEVDPEPGRPTSGGFSGEQAATIVGVSSRQLDYWARTGLIQPTLSSATGSRRYSYKDLLELRVIKTLLDAGIKLESVRDVFEYLREHVGEDISSAHLVVAGNSVVLARGDELVEVLNKGQGVLNVLSLEGIKDDVDAQLVPLSDADGTSDDLGTSD